METHSSLSLHFKVIAIGIALVMLAAAPITSCGGDDTTTPTAGSGGATGTGGSTGTSGAGGVDAGEHDATTAVDSATADGARADTSSDLSNTDRTNAADSARDNATTIDRFIDETPPRSDVTTLDTRAPDAVVADTTSIDIGQTDAPPPPTDGSAPMCSLCANYGAAKQLGKVANASLNNLSGIATSRINTNVLYVHNDMSASQFFALSSAAGSEAALLGTYTMTGVTVADIEDIGVGPCGANSCVYIADIGGNITARTEFSVIRAPEPTVQVGQSPATQSIAAEKLAFKYPDGASHNAESLLVDPASGTVYIITKVAAGMPSTVYRLGSTFGGATVTAEKIIDLTVPKSSDKEATSASAHPCAPAFLLRTYNTLYEFRAPAGSPFEAAFQATPTVVPAATETQGEGVTYAWDGQSYFTTTEGSSPPINVVNCQ